MSKMYASWQLHPVFKEKTTKMSYFKPLNFHINGTTISSKKRGFLSISTYITLLNVSFTNLVVLHRHTQTWHEKAVHLYLCPRTWIANKFSRHQHNDLIETQPLAVGRNISLHREMPEIGGTIPLSLSSQQSSSGIQNRPKKARGSSDMRLNPTRIRLAQVPYKTLNPICDAHSCFPTAVTAGE